VVALWSQLTVRVGPELKGEEYLGRLGCPIDDGTAIRSSGTTYPLQGSGTASSTDGQRIEEPVGVRELRQWDGLPNLW